LFACSWERAVFLHYEVAPPALQPFVPFPLDCREGKAYISLVAFHLRNMRLRAGGIFTRWMTAPIAGHPFLNLRAYVKVGGRPGIFFLREWLPNRASLLLGPAVYGLPYHWGDCQYRHAPENGSIQGSVQDAQGRRLAYRLEWPRQARFQPSAPGSLDAFLLERYHAFTRLPGRRPIRMFTVGHAPWPQAQAAAEVTENTLLPATGGWFRQARLIGANYSPGFAEVRMGRPVRLQPQPEELHEHAPPVL
jgi:uncharacterized protein YqjF (DUF2071 family)